MNQQAAVQTITRHGIKGAGRMKALPRHFGGRLMMHVEGAIYNVARKYCSAYNGGRWIFYNLSNGGFYMAPDLGKDKVAAINPENYYSGTMSADALGIVSCIIAYSHLSGLEWLTDGERDRLITHYQRLREYALDHPEEKEIFGAINWLPARAHSVSALNGGNYQRQKEITNGPDN